MNRAKKEYLKSLVVQYHRGRGCGLWPQSCNGSFCNGHIGHINKGEFEELEVDEYNFVKQLLGLALNNRKYVLPLHILGERNRRNEELGLEVITSPSDLFKIVRKYESRTYVDPELLIEKFGCKTIEKEGCCFICDPPEEEIEEE